MNIDGLVKSKNMFEIQLSKLIIVRFLPGKRKSDSLGAIWHKSNNLK
jgi:hypothetical protein